MENTKDTEQTIESLYKQDVEERLAMNWQDEGKVAKLTERDSARRQKTRMLMASEVFSTGLDYHYAALIFQHGVSTQDYETAHELAAKAVELGDNTAKWLYAATLDRWLLSQGKPQKFGTQIREEGGEVEIGPVDPSITDEERARRNVPPLAESVQLYKKNMALNK